MTSLKQACGDCYQHIDLIAAETLQALEKEAEAGAALDSYEVEGPDRAEMLTNLGEFQLAVVSMHDCFCVAL